MKKCLVIAACLGLLVLTACTGRPPRRCNQWGWYKPCDLIEGQGGCDSVVGRPGGGCDPCGYQAGQVVRTEMAYPAPCASPQAGDVVHVTPVEPLPAPEPIEPTPSVDVIE